MSHPRVEEVSDSDSDPEISDISTLPTDSRFALSPTDIPSSNNNPPVSSNNTTNRNPSLLNPQHLPQQHSHVEPPSSIAAAAKRWAVLYPLYFDASASREAGRRVSRDLAVANPLATGIAEAVKARGLMSVFEPTKRHGRDWANPGRVRVRIREDDGRMVAGLENKHHLIHIVAKWLKAHPTKPEDPLKLPLRGLPVPEGIPPVPAKPRGWRMNDIIPLHSPAMTGGGVSENMLKDIQDAIQSGEMPGMPSGMPPGMGFPGMPSGGPSQSSIEGGKKKKDKGKKK